MLKLSFDLGSFSPPVVVAPQLWRVKRDQYTRYELDREDLNEFGVRAVAPDPAVFRTGEFNNHKNFLRTPFDRGWQVMLADLLAMQKFGKLFRYLSGDQYDYIVRAFGGLTMKGRAFTNGKGTDNCTNYIEGIVRGEDPKFDPLICADDYVQVLEVRKNARGIVMARLNSFREPVPVTNLLLSDPRILRATIITRTGGIAEFPQLDGTPILYPYISSQDVWYPLDDLEAA